MCPDMEQYNAICKERFDEIRNSARDDKHEILATIKGLSDRLFMDNGNECIQSKLNRHDKWIKGVIAVGAVIATGLFGVALWVLKIYLTKNI